MSPELKELENQALKLPLQDRAALAHSLISSLDTEADGDVEALWLDEAERRYNQYKKGNIPARAADEVLRDARASLK